MFLEEKIREINQRLEKAGNGKIAVWCLGVHTEKLAEYTDLLKYNIKFFIDKNADMYGKDFEIYGKPVRSPREAAHADIDYIVISTYKYQNEILAELKSRGMEEKAVTLYSDTDEGDFYLLPDQKNKDCYFTGNFSSWNEAAQLTKGYADDRIAEKVLYATRQVMEHKACYERDSVLFYTRDYNYRLISLFGILASQQSHINILDFGGALGSEYWRNREFLYKFKTGFTWNVVEQKHYVEIGNREITSHELKFYSSIDQLEGQKINLIILSGVLQCLPHYQTVLSELAGLGAEYILIDRQTVGSRSRICIQYVGENIYCASYPIRILAEQELMEFLCEKYKKAAEYESESDSGRAYVDGAEFRYKGYIMERKNM